MTWDVGRAATATQGTSNRYKEADKILRNKSGKVAHTFNLSNREADEFEASLVWSTQSSRTSQNYIVRPCLKKGASNFLAGAAL